MIRLAEALVQEIFDQKNDFLAHLIIFLRFFLALLLNSRAF